MLSVTLLLSAPVSCLSVTISGKRCCQHKTYFAAVCWPVLSFASVIKTIWQELPVVVPDIGAREETQCAVVQWSLFECCACWNHCLRSRIFTKRYCRFVMCEMCMQLCHTVSRAVQVWNAKRNSGYGSFREEISAMAVLFLLQSYIRTSLKLKLNTVSYVW